MSKFLQFRIRKRKEKNIWSSLNVHCNYIWLSRSIEREIIWLKDTVFLFSGMFDGECVWMLDHLLQLIESAKTLQTKNGLCAQNFSSDCSHSVRCNFCPFFLSKYTFYTYFNVIWSVLDLMLLNPTIPTNNDQWIWKEQSKMKKRTNNNTPTVHQRWINSMVFVWLFVRMFL